MAGRDKPDIGLNKDRRFSDSGFDPSLYDKLDSDSLTDFINAAKRSGNPIYGDLQNPRATGLGIAQEDPEVSESTQTMVDMVGTGAKAKYLLDLINKAQKTNKIFIPVTGNQKVKQAISRVFPGSSPGYDKAYWEIWLAVVQHKIRQSELIGADFLSQCSGNSAEDDERLGDTLDAFDLAQSNALSRTLLDGDSDQQKRGTRAETYQKVQKSDNADLLKELFVYGAALIGLFILNKKLAAYKAPDSHVVSVNSTIYPSPAGLGIMIVQIIVGLALHFIIEGLLANDVHEALERIDLPGISEKERLEIIESALELASGKKATVGPLAGKDLQSPEVQSVMGMKDDVLNTAKAFYLRGDYDIIFEYCESWLAANVGAVHIKDDFSQWVILPELESTAYSIETAVETAAYYSKEFNDNYKKSDEELDKTKVISNTIDQARQDFLDQLAKPSARAAHNSGTPTVGESGYEAVKDKIQDYDMLGSLLTNFQDQNCKYNSSLDKLAAFLTHDPMISTVICCFIKYFGAVDVKLLLSIRSILMLFANGVSFDLGNFLNSITSNIYDDIFNKARARLMAVINTMFNALVESITSWMDSEALDILSNCLPIDVLLRFVVSSIGEIELSLTKVLDDYLAHMQIQNYSLDAKISILAEQRWAKILYTIIDSIIIVLEQERDCAITGDPFVNDQTRNLIDLLLGDPGRENSIATYDAAQNGILGTLGKESRTAEETDSVEKLSVLDQTPLTTDPRYASGIVTDELKNLLAIPSEFNTFTDINTFYTDAGIGIDSIIKNLRSDEMFKRTTSEALSPEQMETCFDDINQTELLKRVLGKANGQ